MGNVKYIGWKVEFYCQQNLVEDLQEIAKQMEEELEKWKEEVRNTRNEFYELNYYTTRQLLVLRSELGKLKEPVPPPYQRAKVMALLQSISCNITPNGVQRVVAMERKTNDREKPREESTVATMETSSSSSYQQPPVPPSSTNWTEEMLASVDAQTCHIEEDTSLKGAVGKLSVSDLDTKQMEIFIDITEKCRYPEKFALKAIEENRTGDWIQDNEAMAEEMLQSTSDEDSEEEESEGEEEEEMEQRGTSSKNVTSEKSQENDIMDEALSQGAHIHNMYI